MMLIILNCKQVQCCLGLWLIDNPTCPHILSSHRVVTEDCYPYLPPQQTPAEASRCMMQSRSIGRGKRQATQRCPNSHNYHNDIYQSTPPYRLSTNVSTNTHTHTHTDSGSTLERTFCLSLRCDWKFSAVSVAGCVHTTESRTRCYTTFHHQIMAWVSAPPHRSVLINSFSWFQ